jgi:hypothetical protein
MQNVSVCGLIRLPTVPIRWSADLRSGALPSSPLSWPGGRLAHGSGGRLVCRIGLASRRPGITPTKVDGSETIYNVGAFYPSGGAPISDPARCQAVLCPSRVGDRRS